MIHNKWLNFVFVITSNNDISMKLFAPDNSLLIELEGINDKDYSEFDRIAVHGGWEYYIDNIEVKIT